MVVGDDLLLLSHSVAGGVLLILALILAIDVYRKILGNRRKLVFYVFVVFGLLAFVSGALLIYKGMHTNVQIVGGVLGFIGFIVGLLNEIGKIEDSRSWYATLLLLIIAVATMLV